MRAGLFTFLSLVLLLLALPLGQDQLYFGQLNTRKIASEPVAVPEEAPVYQILEDLTPPETAILVRTFVVFSRDPQAPKINLFDLLLAWQETIDTYVAQHPLPQFSEHWHALLKTLAEHTSKKGRLTGTAFLNALAASPLAEEIILYFMQQQLTLRMQDRLLAQAVAAENIWGSEDFTEFSSAQSSCGPRSRWPQLAQWIEQLSSLRPRPLGMRSWRQLNGGTYLIKKHLPQVLWGDQNVDERKLAEAVNELWMAEALSGPQLCQQLISPRGQMALRDLGLPPITEFVQDNPAVIARLQKQIASGRTSAAAFEIYCHKFIVPQIFEVAPSPKDQKRHQLDLKIALRYFER